MNDEATETAPDHSANIATAKAMVAEHGKSVEQVAAWLVAQTEGAIGSVEDAIKLIAE